MAWGSRLKRLGFAAALLALIWLAVEASVALVAPRFGGGFSVRECRELRRELTVDSGAEEAVSPEAAPLQRRQVLHPYLGYVLDPRSSPGIDALGFWKPLEPAAPPANGDPIVVGIFGGSFAMGIVSRAGGELAALLEEIPAFRGRPCEIRRVALGGYKQPQQLMALVYLLAWGERFDVVINIDGFNELVLPVTDNMLRGVSPFYPRGWDRRVNSIPAAADLKLMGELALIEARRRSLAECFSRFPLSRSAVGNIVWAFWDGRCRIRRDRVRERLRTAEDLSSGSVPYLLSGPPLPPDFEEAPYRRLAEFWGRCSRLMRDICESNGIVYLHFLQPNQYVPGSKPMGIDEKRTAFRENHPYRSVVEQGYPQLVEEGEKLKEGGVGFHDLSMIFAGDSAPYYVDDCCHLGDAGSRLVVAAIAEAVGKAWNEQSR
ncbi:MAG TPA: hypothetical protein PK636_05190 [bacterium]|nr:hypothetical protein [bacterium]